MTRKEAITYLTSQRNVPDGLYDYQEMYDGAVEFLATVSELPETFEELLDMHIAYLNKKLGFNIA